MQTNHHVTTTNAYASLLALTRALHRLGSGHKSSGVWLSLFFMFKFAPFAARNWAIEALLCLSAMCPPIPIKT